MPNVVGAVDGTFVPILAPTKDEPSFVCRKGYHALNVQGIVDANLRFTNVVAKWPGSAHDSFVWSNSNISTIFENGRVDGWLLGDSAYPLRPWLMTPILRPSNEGEEKYNRSHIKTRNVVERAFGLWKSRFRCLHKSTGCLMFSPQKCCKIVTATCILHNVCITKGLPLLDVEDEEEIDNQNQEYRYNGALNDGLATRLALIQNRFQ